MSVWFEGNSHVDCSLSEVAAALANYAEHCAGVVSHMPGLTSVEIVDQGPDSVTIKTNEGLMERTNISVHVEQDQAVVEYDEKYQAGSRVTVTSHFVDEFTRSDNGVTHRLVMSNVTAPGFLGFLYRKLGGSKIGNAFLASYKAYLETPQG
ncbi:MAG: hypothetical protein KJP12_02515 [Acidimicrobiia bacterium]|nr:hypothetical protein [Acidimicrobiia bacterium]